MKKFLVTFIIAIILMVIGYSAVYSVFANDNFSLTDHDTEATTTGYTEAKDAVETITGTILAVLRYAGAGIAMISLVLIGAKYLYASPGEKADYKKNLLVYTVGGIGMFSVGTILKIIRDLSAKIESGS